MIVLLKLHFQIESGEFRKMSSGVAVFGAEDCTNFHDALEPCGNQHLLVQLRRLCEVGRAVKVLDFKYVGSAFGRGAYKLGGMDKSEAVLTKVLLEQTADACL